MGKDKPRIETLAAHAGNAVDPTTGAITLPIHMSTTYERDADGAYSRGFIYSRSENPTRQALEDFLAALEGGTAAAAFSSGQAAATTVFHILLPGDHVIAPDDAYMGVTGQLRETFVPWGLQVSFVDMTDPANVEEAVRPNTKLIWAESPSNPQLKITDIKRMVEIAHRAGAICACDDTWVTPIIQRPLELGADLVIHSTTKFIGGHSDVVGGAVIAKENGDLFNKIKRIQSRSGAVPSPFDCWLILRGVRTLPYRIRAHSENAMKVAAFLSEHPAVERVNYPGLKSHPGHEVAARQMVLFGGMLSFLVKGGKDEAMAVVAKVKLFTRATSLGGTESLIEHRASIEGPNSQTPQNLLRVSVGLEHPDDLIDDLAQALRR